MDNERNDKPSSPWRQPVVWLMVALVAYAWVPPEHAEVGNPLEIEYFGVRHQATVTEEPLFDPAMKRMRG